MISRVRSSAVEIGLCGFHTMPTPGSLAVLKSLNLKGCVLRADASHCHPALAEAALAAKARAGVRVRVLYDWVGALNATSLGFWRRLRAAGVHSAPADGRMGRPTVAALRQYQRLQGLPAIGEAREKKQSNQEMYRAWSATITDPLALPAFVITVLQE